MPPAPDSSPEEDDDSEVTTGPATLPEAAEKRLRSPTFSSGLSVNEFAACLHMGMRPVGLVQGFCAMRWVWRSNSYQGNYTRGYYSGGRYRAGNYGGYQGFYGYRTRTLTNYSCPHSFYARSEEHAYYGSNQEVLSLEDAWESGFNTAMGRMVAEARELGAHGILGVVDRSHSLIDAGLREFHVIGTAIVLDGQPAPSHPWSTFLAGQRLAKLLEAGLVPVSVAASAAAVAIFPYCVTEYREAGHYDTYGTVSPEGEISQVADAQMGVRRVARDRIRRHLGNDSLHGADLRTEQTHLGSNRVLLATLRGTRVHQFRHVEPLPAPVPTVRMS